MNRRPNHVPKFGNWDANDHVPFTVVFENARAGKGVNNKMINPNDPSQNPEAFGLVEDHSGAPSSEPSEGVHRIGLQPEQMTPDFRTRKSSFDSSVQDNAGGDLESYENQVFDHCPSPHQGHFGTSPASASPVWERKMPSAGGNTIASGTPGKTRFRPGSKVEETPDRSPALPRFGEWNEKGPASAEGFTVIFNQARNEKKAGGPVRIPTMQAGDPVRIPTMQAESAARMDKQNQEQQKAAQRKPPAWACCLFEPGVL